jgi:hypothetical protein
MTPIPTGFGKTFPTGPCLLHGTTWAPDQRDSHLSQRVPRSRPLHSHVSRPSIGRDTGRDAGRDAAELNGSTPCPSG